MGEEAEARTGPPAVRRRRGRRSRDGREPQGERDPAAPLPRGGQLEDDLDRLELGLRPFSIDLDLEARGRMLVFARELIAWNDRLNLLSRSDVYNVVRKHIAASLGVFLCAPPARSERWIDVGTGAGFPGLVLKIARTDLAIDLLDSSRKRCLFIESVARQLRLGPLSVLPMRAETLLGRGDAAGTYDVVTTRAVASLRDALEFFGPLVSPEGRMVTFKGPQWRDELEEAQRGGALDRGGFAFESATRIPWAVGHLLTLRRTTGGTRRDP